MKIELKRAYDDVEESDGVRILVDRLWPRGLKKEDAKLDLWLKEIAPSTELRKWFDHDAEKWSGFRGRYQTELKHHPDEIEQIRDQAKKGKVTLIYASRDTKHNEAVVLKAFLEKHDK